MKSAFRLLAAIGIGVAIAVTAIAWWPEIRFIEKSVGQRVRGDHLPRSQK